MPADKYALEEWFETAVGVELLKSEARCLTQVICSKWGDHLLQIGGPKSKLLRDVSPIIHQLCFSDHMTEFEEASLVLIDYRELALLPNSVDVILLPHLLESISNPKLLLEELYQALKPEGLLIVFSFNPLGVGALWRWHFKQQGLMSGAKWWSACYLMELLQAVGFNEINRYSAGFHLPIHARQSKLRAVEKSLNWLFPLAGAVNILSAKKEELAAITHFEWNIKPSLGALQNQAHDTTR